MKKKIESICSQYRRELRKLEKSKKSGAVADDIYTPTLWCFNDLCFLSDGDSMRESVSSMDSQVSHVPEEVSDHEPPPKIEATPATRSRVLHSREKELIYNVNKYFLQEKANRGPLIDPTNPIARTAKATNVSEVIVRQICSTFSQACSSQMSPKQPELSSLTKKHNATVTNLDNFDKRVLRRTVLKFYERSEVPTLHTVKEELKENISYSGSIESLRKVLKEIGFKYGKVNGCKFLMERSDVVAARTRFLREMRQFKQSFRNIVYIDETWVNRSYIVGKRWTDTACQEAKGIQPPSGKGSRLIILHAGTKDGFVDNGELIFQAKNDADYHNQMNSAVFEEWFRNQLLSNIAPNSVIVMHNATYHSVQLEKMPSSSWKKEDIKDWLVKKGVQPSDELFKAELCELSKKYAVCKKYQIDQIAEEAGHKVVRLPPHHCHYNPIALIWAQVKSYIAKSTFKMANLKLLVKEAVSQVTPQNWLWSVQHVEQLQEEDAKQDIAVDNFMDSLIINISENSDDEFSD